MCQAGQKNKQCNAAVKMARSDLSLLFGVLLKEREQQTAS